jgi:hypothetical protein
MLPGIQREKSHCPEDGGKKKSPFLMDEERGFSGWLLLLDLNQQPFD